MTYEELAPDLPRRRNPAPEHTNATFVSIQIVT